MEEQIKLRDFYVQDSQLVEGKFEVLGQMWSNWAGNYWAILGTFETREEAEKGKSQLDSGEVSYLEVMN